MIFFWRKFGFSFFTLNFVQNPFKMHLYKTNTINY